MKATLNRTDFGIAAADIARIAPAKHYNPIMSGAHITINQDHAILSGYDLERGITVRIDRVESDSANEQYVVSAKLLAAIAKVLPKKPVTITEADNSLNLTCGTAHFTLPLLAAHEYPALPKAGERSGTIPGDVFVTAVQKAAVAAFREDIDALENITSIYIEVEGDTIRFTATDRYRLSTEICDWDNTAGLNWTALVPADALLDVSKAIDGQPVVRLHHSDSNLGISTPNTTATIPLVGAEYPAYEKLIPKQFETQTVVYAKDLSDALSRSLVTADVKGHVILQLTPSGVNISATQDGFGSGSETIPTIEHVGDDITMRMRAGYLKAGINTTGTDIITISVVNNRRPVMIYPGTWNDLTEPDLTYRHLVMPVAMK